MIGVTETSLLQGACHLSVGTRRPTGRSPGRKTDRRSVPTPILSSCDFHARDLSISIPLVFPYEGETAVLRGRQRNQIVLVRSAREGLLTS